MNQIHKETNRGRRAEIKTKSLVWFWTSSDMHIFKKKKKSGNFKPSFYQQYAGKIWSLKRSHMAQTPQQKNKMTADKGIK